MIPELGHFALILAAIVALVLGILPLIGAHWNRRPLIALTRPATWAMTLLIVVAYLCLTYAFLNNDFSVIYVARHGNTLLPVPYKIAAVWGGHEGSLLLWALLLALWALTVSLFSRHLPGEMRARVLGTLGLISFGFLSFILLTSNPFERVLPALSEGGELNPMLQDPGLVFHPPMLYMGYVGFSVAFAFAIAALLSGRLDAAWARWSRPWTTIAWVFLTLGIALGSWWAYYELGWGGWWFWDPVENASFMPWLVGTALVHSLAVTEKRGSFKNWTVLLAISAFSLSLLGTFLVRSGVLTSVHAFATDPARGIYILVFLSLVIGSSLLLFAWRAPTVGLGGRFSVFSRESLLLCNNVVLVVAAGAVLLGTLYPLLVDALGLNKISVGPPYFNQVFAPLMIPILFLIGVGPFARWKQAEARALVYRLGAAFVVALAIGVAVPFALGRWSDWVAFAITMAAWIVLTALQNLLTRFNKGVLPPLSFWGMHTAHIGIAVFVAGVALVKGYELEKDVKMMPGDTVALAGYTFQFNGVRKNEGPNYIALIGDVGLSAGQTKITTLYPEKRFYRSSSMPMTEAAIDSGFSRDLYISLGEAIDKENIFGAWAVRVYYKPFVNWIWGGCLLMALGGLLAMADRRYRIARQRTGGAQ